jgi:Protein of unknown function (DUF642)
MASTKSRYFLSMAAVSALFAAAPMARANLLTNGDFETGVTPPQTNGNQQTIPAGSTNITGWTATGGPGSDGIAWLANGNQFGVSSESGVDFLDLTGLRDTAPYFGVSQSIPTTIGQTYTLSFFIGVDNSNGLFTGPVGVSASAGATSQTFSNINPTGTGNIWTPESLNFTATGTSTAITLTGTQGNQYIGLDNVSVVATPEPASLALLTLTAPLLLRRRRTA